MPSIPRSDPLERAEEPIERFPSHGIRQSKLGESGQTVPTHTLKSHTGTPDDLGSQSTDHTHPVRAVVSSDDVSNPPTDAELDTAFGQPSDVMDGFIGVLDDNGAGTTMWLCVAVNGAWWFEQLTKAT